MDEPTFLAAILAEPRADAPRLAYADWLEEHGDCRGEFLRALVRLEELEQQYPLEQVANLRRVREIARLRRRLRELFECIPVHWALKVYRGWVSQEGMRGRSCCANRWELLEETDSPTVRRCPRCSRTVKFCRKGQELATGHGVVKSAFG